MRVVNKIVEPVKTEVLSLDKDHNIVPLEKACWNVTVGYDETGELVFESWEEIKQ